jgi:exopolysaccharide production protein ExoQ
MASFVFPVCWIFIAFLLVLDSRRRRSVSAATWIPTILLLVLFSRTPTGWLVSGQDAGTAYTGGNLLDQLFFAAMIAASLFITLSRGVKWGKLFSINRALVVFYAYFLLSIAWSFSPADSLIRVIKDFGCTVIAVSAVLSEKDPVEAVRAIYVRCACILIPLSAALVRFSPLGKGYSKDGTVTFGGACQTKNEFGELLLISILFLVWDHMEMRIAAGANSPLRGMTWDRVVLILTGLWLLNLSQSRTSLVALVIALALVVRSGWFDSKSVSRFALVAALFYPVIALTSQTVLAPVLAMLGRDATFTGRANIWQHITFSTVNPLIGAGFWNFWGGPGGKAIEAAMQTGIPNAHDGYLDIYLDGGLIGVFLLVVVLVTCGKRLIRQIPRDRYSRFKYAFLITAIIHNVTESSFARPSGMWFTIVLALINFPGLSEKIRANGEGSRNGKRSYLSRQVVRGELATSPAAHQTARIA